MHQNPESGEPMETFRHTPVDKKMPVRTYERFSQVVSHLLQPNGRIMVVSEWAGQAVKVCMGSHISCAELCYIFASKTSNALLMWWFKLQYLQVA